MSGGFAVAQTEQSDTIVSLPIFIVEGQKGFKSSKIDSLTLEEKQFESLAEILAFHSPIFIKNYGKGSLALTSFRGASSRHTKILWNNFNINSVGLGVTDLSLVPAGLMEDVDIAYGGGSLANGSGGLGGSVLLNNKSSWDEGYDVKYNVFYGSFSDARQNLNISYGNSKIQGSTKVITSNSKNDFSYLNITKQDTPTENQVNGRLDMFHFMQDVYYKPNKKHTFQLSFWGLQNVRQIPPTLYSIESATLLNASNRGFVEWKHFNNPTSFIELKSGYSYDYVNYYGDTLTNIDTKNLGQFWESQFKWNKQLPKKIYLKTGVEYRMEFSLSDSYQEGTFSSMRSEAMKTRNVGNAFADVSIKSLKNFTFNVHARQQFVDNEVSPFIYSGSVEANVIKDQKMNWKASFVQNYNLPSMCDLYWQQGGDSNLVAEEGWMAETGLSSHFNITDDFELETEATGYVSRIENWIQWTPTGYFWSAENLKEVYRRGFELSAHGKMQFNKIKIEAKSIYSFVKATNEIGIADADSSVGKQLIYVPLHNVQSFLRIRFKKMSLTYENSYTGKRYVYTDNTGYMPAYTIGNSVIGNLFELKKMDLNFKIRVYNIWNRQFQAIQNRPMPGRYYGVSLGVKFGKTKKTVSK